MGVASAVRFPLRYTCVCILHEFLSCKVALLRRFRVGSKRRFQSITGFPEAESHSLDDRDLRAP